MADRIPPLLLRLALSVTLLSAVADRFGIRGPPGAAGVAWGDWTHFVAYTAKVNGFLPEALAPALAIIATAAEALLGITLILGIFRRPVAFASAAVFALFAGAMTMSFGVKTPLNFSVFVDFAAHFFWALGQRRQNSNKMWLALNWGAEGTILNTSWIRFGQLYRLKLYKKPAIRELQLLQFFGTENDPAVTKTMEDQPDINHVARLGPEDSYGSTEGLNLRRSQGIRWENHEQAQYFVGRIGPATFEINSGVGGMFAAMFSLAGDCYAVLSTAKTVGEAKRFCEWVARGYGLDASC